MNKHLRRIIFLGFVLLFFIIAPLTVLYTAGYRYDSQYGIVSKTGVLSVTTTPRGASVLLDGEEYASATPKIIKRLMPKPYSITLDKAGFFTWTNQVEVREGLTTYIEDIVLFRKSSPTILVEQEIAAAAIDENALVAAYTTLVDGEYSLWTYDTDKENHKQIADLKGEATTLSWSASGNYLLVVGKEIRVFEKDGSEIEIYSSHLADFEEVYWHPSEDKLLVVITNKNIVHFDVEKNSALIVDSSQASTIPVDASLLSFIDNGSQVELRQTIGSEQKLIALLDRGSYQIVFRAGSFILAKDNLGYIHLIDINSSQPLLMQAKADLFDWSTETNELLYSDGFEINIYSADRHATEFIARQSSRITDLAWHPSGDAIIFSTHDGLFAMDRNLFGSTRQKTTLVEGSSFSNFWISENGKQAFIFGKYNDSTGLFQLRLR